MYNLSQKAYTIIIWDDGGDDPDNKGQEYPGTHQYLPAQSYIKLAVMLWPKTPCGPEGIDCISFNNIRWSSHSLYSKISLISFCSVVFCSVVWSELFIGLALTATIDHHAPSPEATSAWIDLSLPHLISALFFQKTSCFTKAGWQQVWVKTLMRCHTNYAY